MKELFQEAESALRGCCCSPMNMNQAPIVNGTSIEELVANAAAMQPMPSNASMTDCNTCMVERIGLAQAFVPVQSFTNTMDENRSLICGTVFPELVSPYRKGTGLACNQ